MDPKQLVPGELYIDNEVEKLEAAKAYLGTRWVLHPLYNRNPAIQVRDAYFLRNVRTEAVLNGRI